MMYIFLNGLGASAGAGLTYLYNVVPRLSSVPDVHTTLAVQPQLRPEFERFANVTVLNPMVPAGAMRRFWFEQRELPHLVRDCGADVLLSTGNFAVRNSPAPQILLSGNSLYTSSDFYRDLRRRHEYRMLCDTKLRGYFAKKSVRWADCTVAPSQAFADELRRWTGKEVSAIHHGFDSEVFFGDNSLLPAEVNDKLITAGDSLRLLFVSHYNYYRNFETLFRAVALLRDRMPQRKVRLFLTCTLDDEKTPGAYKTGAAVRVVRELGLQEEVVELGAVPYRLLHHLYRACDIYVTAAYAETFAHPLVEAMACGLPIIASDLPAHREVCGRSASYFPPFSAEALVDEILAAGSAPKNPDWPQAQRFSWSNHVRAILGIVATLVAARKGRSPALAGFGSMGHSNTDCLPGKPAAAARH
jgi:glycosyltransferase involved in cell wall biosynthesis